MRVVFDTNVIISAALFDAIPEQAVLSILGREHHLVLSPFIVEETRRILVNKFHVDPEEVSLFLQLLSQAEMQYFQPFLNILRDKPDNRVLETALKGKADFIITGDRSLLGLGVYQGVQIVKPADFLRYAQE